MADDIVETEDLMATMCATCCVSAPTSLASVLDTRVYEKNTSRRVQRVTEYRRINTHPSRSQLLTRLSSAVHRSLSGISLSKRNVHFTYSRYYVASEQQRPNNTDSEVKEVDHDVASPMPCETWWDPFCCAAEVCADMMVEMMELMANGADSMTELCQDCIDEVPPVYLWIRSYGSIF